MDSKDVQLIDSSRRAVVISHNPRSGAGNRVVLVRQLEEELRRRRFDVDCYSDIDQLVAAVQERRTEGVLRTVVAAGGDGTVALLLNRLTDSVPLTVFPLGTANLLAQFSGASKDILRTADVITGGRMVSLDLGKRQWQPIHGRSELRLRRRCGAPTSQKPERSYQLLVIRLAGDQSNFWLSVSSDEFDN